MANAFIDARGLNAQWDALAVQFDKYYGALLPTVRTAVQAALAKWQDFYFGTDPTTQGAELMKWAEILSKTEETLIAATKTAAPAAAVNQAGGKVVGGNVISISGKNEMTPGTVPDFRLPSVWWFAAGSVPALLALYLSRPSRKERS